MNMKKTILALLFPIPLALSASPPEQPPPGPCNGCFSSTGEAWQIVHCPEGGTAQIRIDVYPDDGFCELLDSPWVTACIPKEPCQPYVFTQIGSTTPQGMTMWYTNGDTHDVPCGTSKTIVATGSCGASVSLVLVCSECP